jgi:hypothetical protein
MRGTWWTGRRTEGKQWTMEGWTDKRKEGGRIVEEEIGELLRLSIRKIKQPSRQSDDSEDPRRKRTLKDVLCRLNVLIYIKSDDSEGKEDNGAPRHKEHRKMYYQTRRRLNVLQSHISASPAASTLSLKVQTSSGVELALGFVAGLACSAALQRAGDLAPLLPPSLPSFLPSFPSLPPPPPPPLPSSVSFKLSFFSSLHRVPLYSLLGTRARRV